MLTLIKNCLTMPMLIKLSEKKNIIIGDEMQVNCCDVKTKVQLSPWVGNDHPITSSHEQVQYRGDFDDWKGFIPCGHEVIQKSKQKLQCIERCSIQEEA